MWSHNTLLSQRFILEPDSHCGNSGQRLHSKDGGGMRSLQLSLVWLEGQPAVTSSPWLPLTKAIYYPWLCEGKELKYKVNSVLKSCLLTSALLRKHSWEDLAGSISHQMWVWNHSASPSVQRRPQGWGAALFPPLFSSCCFSNTQYTLSLLNLCPPCSYIWKLPFLFSPVVYALPLLKVQLKFDKWPLGRFPNSN